MGRIAIVTGGTRGIGAAVAHSLKKSGHTVVAVYYGNVAAADAFQQGAAIPVYRWNIADFGACEAGVREVAKDLGGPVEIVVNNGGITRDAMLHKMTPGQWHEVIAVDLSSCFNMCRAVINGMRERGFGRIVNISSINGQKGQFGQTNYAAAKAGVIGFSKALALETASKGITVNVVAPGYIATDMLAGVPKEVLKGIEEQIPIGRLGQPNEIARVVEFLVSDEAAFITGATITANGGQYLA